MLCKCKIVTVKTSRYAVMDAKKKTPTVFRSLCATSEQDNLITFTGDVIRVVLNLPVEHGVILVARDDLPLLCKTPFGSSYPSAHLPFARRHALAPRWVSQHFPLFESPKAFPSKPKGHIPFRKCRDRTLRVLGGQTSAMPICRSRSTRISRSAPRCAPSSRKPSGLSSRAGRRSRCRRVSQ